MQPQLADSFTQNRPLLFSLAYRMLGSATEAEDAVQETYLRAQRPASQPVRSPRAYLVSVLTRLCIDQLRSARARRESYVGAWLPEPIETAPDVAESAALAESVSMAFLVLLESLNPVERAVFLLREVFDYDYPEIAEIVGKTEANCRQIARRAREHVEARRPRFEPSLEKRRQVVERFAAACVNGDMEGLLQLLHADITMTSDGGGKARAALNPIRGADRVARFLMGVSSKRGPDARMEPALLNGQPGFLTYTAEGLHSAWILDIAGGRIQAVRAVLNPDKLVYLGRNTSA